MICENKLCLSDHFAVYLCVLLSVPVHLFAYPSVSLPLIFRQMRLKRSSYSLSLYSSPYFLLASLWDHLTVCVSAYHPIFFSMQSMSYQRKVGD
jgi:hypothetical protein